VNLGPHAGFIVIAYAIAFAVVAALVLWVIVDARVQRRTLDELEARGIRRAGERQQ
jgi:heme exporter protein D